MEWHQHHNRIYQGARQQRGPSQKSSMLGIPSGGDGGGGSLGHHKQHLPAGLWVNTAGARAQATSPDADEVSPLTDDEGYDQLGREVDQLSVSSRSCSTISLEQPNEDSASAPFLMTDRTAFSLATSSGGSTLFAGLGGGIAMPSKGSSATPSPATPTSIAEVSGSLNVKAGGGGLEPSSIMDAQSRSLRNSQSSSSGLGIIHEDRNKGQQQQRRQGHQQRLALMMEGKASRKAPVVPPASPRRGNSNSSNTMQSFTFEAPTGRTSGPSAGFTVTTVTGGAAAGAIPPIVSLPPPPSTRSSSSSNSATTAAMDAAARAFRAQTLGSITVISSTISDEKQQRIAAVAAAKQSRLISLFSRLRYRTGSSTQDRGEDFPAGLMSESPSRNSPPSPSSPRPFSGGGKTEAVFGVPLDDSLNAAGYRVRVSHRGKSTSHRILPICVYKCCEFLRTNSTNHLVFAAPGDTVRVWQLLEVFSSLPDYGESFDFSPSVEGDVPFSVADAARVVTIFLERLPKPAVTNSAAKVWVRLARQEGALGPPNALGSGSARGGGSASSASVSAGLEFSGIDLWTEAMSRLPAAGRTLVKYLLNLWAELARGADGAADASTRQVAASVAHALFQFGDAGGAKTVRQTLALAWLIKKRAETDRRTEESTKALACRR